jgi:hypothetical protein
VYKVAGDDEASDVGGELLVTAAGQLACKEIHTQLPWKEILWWWEESA